MLIQLRVDIIETPNQIYLFYFMFYFYEEGKGERASLTSPKLAT